MLRLHVPQLEPVEHVDAKYKELYFFKMDSINIEVRG